MSKKYLDTKEGSLEQSVLGVWKEAAKEQISRQEALSAKQKKLDVDGDGEIEGSDLAKLRKKAAKKEGLENSPNPANSQHLCAKNVVHEEWGEGECVPTMHAEPDEDGNVEWYDVMFEHGIEKGVVISELKVTRSEAHENHNKKNGKMLKAKKLKEEIEYVEYKFRNKNDAMKAAAYFKDFDVDDAYISSGRLHVDADGEDMSKQHAEVMKKFRPKVLSQEKLNAESYEWGTDEYRKHTQKVTPGQDITDYQNFKVNSMKEALAKVWGLDEDYIVEATGKEIAAKMMKSKTLKAFAPKVAKMKSVTADYL